MRDSAQRYVPFPARLRLGQSPEIGYGLGMKAILHSTIALSLLSLLACASKPPKPKYVDEKNEAKYAQARTIAEPPEKVKRAARAALDQLTRESNPQASDKVQDDENTIYTGWVYAQAKDKYVQYDYNGTPRRKQLAVRHIYGFTIDQTLAGSAVKMNVEEELEQISLKTGEHEGWKRVEADPAAYDLLLRRLRENLRAGD